MKLCRTCNRQKSVRQFTEQTGSADGLRKDCKSCRARLARRCRQVTPRHILTLMIQRCHNPRHPKFHLYGGRGITVCAEWRGRGAFERFIAYVGPRPSPHHSIDRIDNNRGYAPGNVRWATQRQQVNNSSRTLILTYRGVSKTIAEWAVVTGLSPTTIYQRYRRLGWPIERVFSIRSTSRPIVLDLNLPLENHDG